MIEEFERNNIKKEGVEGKKSKSLSTGVSHKSKRMLCKNALKKPTQNSSKKRIKKIKKSAKDRLHKKKENKNNKSDRFGTYETSQPLRIIGHSMLNAAEIGRVRSSIKIEDLFLKIVWQESKELGLRPKPSYAPYNLVKEKSPYLLLEYYEKLVKFKEM